MEFGLPVVRLQGWDQCEGCCDDLGEKWWALRRGHSRFGRSGGLGLNPMNLWEKCKGLWNHSSTLPSSSSSSDPTSLVACQLLWLGPACLCGRAHVSWASLPHLPFPPRDCSPASVPDLHLVVRSVFRSVLYHNLTEGTLNIRFDHLSQIPHLSSEEIILAGWHLPLCFVRFKYHNRCEQAWMCHYWHGTCSFLGKSFPLTEDSHFAFQFEQNPFI